MHILAESSFSPLASITDYLDGYLAQVAGRDQFWEISCFDPMADKLLVMSALSCWLKWNGSRFCGSYWSFAESWLSLVWDFLMWTGGTVLKWSHARQDQDFHADVSLILFFCSIGLYSRSDFPSLHSPDFHYLFWLWLFQGQCAYLSLKIHLNNMENIIEGNLSYHRP